MSILNTKLSVVMPAYNEGNWIRFNLAEASNTLATFAPDYEIIVVDDGSVDDTLQQARLAAEEDKHIVIVASPANQGKGCALCLGTEAATGGMIAFCDADLDIHPRQLESFVRIMQSETCSAVIGSKMHPDSQVEYPWHRFIFSWGYYLMLLGLFRLNVRDTQTGLKLFQANVIKPVMRQILVKRFAFDIEVLAILNSRGYRIVSAPVTIHFRRGTLNSRIKIRDIMNTLRDTLAIFYRLKILHYYDHVAAKNQQ